MPNLITKYMLHFGGVGKYRVQCTGGGRSHMRVLQVYTHRKRVWVNKNLHIYNMLMLLAFAYGQRIHFAVV